MYTVLRAFADLQDDGYYYPVGGMYPRSGYQPDAARVKYLSGHVEALGGPAIAPTEAPEKTTKRAKSAKK